MTLSDQAATGSAEGASVAIALGWKRGVAGDWRDAANVWHNRPPDYQSDLPAVLAEFERRGWEWCGGSEQDIHWVSLWTLPGVSPSPTCQTSGTTIANAACAARLKALENSDG